MDVESQAASADKALQELRQATQVGSAKGKQEERKQQIQTCDRLAKRARDSLEAYRLEVRPLPKEEQTQHQKRIKDLEEGIKQCKAQTDWKRMDSEPAAPVDEPDSGPLNLEQAVELADKTQDKSKASVDRSKKMLLEAEQVGIATLDQMHMQEEQMNKIAEDVEDIKANIVRSKKLVAAIARSAATDRCVQMLCLLVTIAIVVMVALAATGKDGGDFNVPDQVRQTRRLLQILVREASATFSSENRRLRGRPL